MTQEEQATMGIDADATVTEGPMGSVPPDGGVVIYVDDLTNTCDGIAG